MKEGRCRGGPAASGAAGMSPMIEPVARIRIELRGTGAEDLAARRRAPVLDPWRRCTTSSKVAFRWRDYHLYEFVVGERVYGVPSDEDAFYDRRIYKASAIRLKTVVERGVDRFLYVYDFGDDWRHDVIVEEVSDGAEDTEYPAFVDGARRCPPEDVGGAPGFMEFLEAVARSGPRRACANDGVVRRTVRPEGHRRGVDPQRVEDVRRAPPRPAGEPPWRFPEALTRAGRQASGPVWMAALRLVDCPGRCFNARRRPRDRRPRPAWRRPPWRSSPPGRIRGGG